PAAAGAGAAGRGRRRGRGGDPAGGAADRRRAGPGGGDHPRLRRAPPRPGLPLGPPAPPQVPFVPPGDADVQRDQAPDLARAIDRFSPFVLPDPLAGQPRRTRVAGAASTYGRGFDLVAVLAFPASFSPRTRAFLDKVPTRAGPWGEASVIATPLLNGMIFERDGVR